LTELATHKVDHDNVRYKASRLAQLMYIYAKHSIVSKSVYSRNQRRSNKWSFLVMGLKLDPSDVGKKPRAKDYILGTARKTAQFKQT